MSQPSFIEALMKDGEMSNRGFMQRFLYSMPLSRVGSRSFIKPEIPKILLDEYNELITAFLRLDAKEPLREITLTPWAKKQAEWLFVNIETQIGERPELEGWMGKAFGQALRIAGILHCATWGAEAAKHEMDNDVIAAAANIIDYYISHAKAVFTDTGEETQDLKDARTLYRKMLVANADVFTKSDLYALTSRKIPKARLEAALALLIEAQYIMIADETEDDKTRRYALLGSEHGLDESKWELS